MPRMLAEIILQNGDIIKKKLFVQHNKIVVNRPKKGKGNIGDFASFTKESIVQEKKGIWPFKHRVPKVYIMQGADECLSFHNGGTNEYDIPTVDKGTIARYGEAAAIKYSGDQTTKVQVPLSLLILIVIAISINFIVLMVVSGRLKI